jgi:exodeoxyribonuclease VII large subunit
VALVTSPTGAAVRDMLQVMGRRWRGCDVVVLPVAVQGDAAAVQIAAAIRYAPHIPGVDVVITGRGGGSLEDLWAFNEEVVARAIFQCPLPVVSAVGHEIDVSISDLVADVRALTPSEAAELVVPHRAEVAAELDRLRQRLVTSLHDQLRTARMTLDALASRRVLTRPQDRLHDAARRLDELSDRLGRAFRSRARSERQRLDALTAALDSLSPLSVLARGYSVTRREDTGEVVRSAADIQPGERLETLLADGRLISRVENTSPNGENRDDQSR